MFSFPRITAFAAKLLDKMKKEEHPQIHQLLHAMATPNNQQHVVLLLQSIESTPDKNST